jgi:hypothetical protein
MRIALEQAMPDAFGDTGRTQLRAFMDRTVGDRKAARREAVRRAQVTADGRDVDTGSRQALQGTAQSASSLRAISISQPAPEEVAEIIVTGTGIGMPGALAHPRRASKAPWIAASVGVLFALGAVLVPRLVGPQHSSKASAAGVEAGAPLVAPTPAGVATATGPTTNSEPAASSAPAAPPVSPEPLATTEPARTPKPASVRAPTKSARPASKAPADKPKSSGNTDLLAPDYAR